MNVGGLIAYMWLSEGHDLSIHDPVQCRSVVEAEFSIFDEAISREVGNLDEMRVLEFDIFRRYCWG